jgi:hypothetical protein
MSWFGAEIDGPMVVARTIHFAAAATTAGAPMFRALIAEPALRAAPPAGPLVHKQIRALAWIGLATAVVSGLAWVLLLTMSLSDEGLGEAVMSGALRDVRPTRHVLFRRHATGHHHPRVKRRLPEPAHIAARDLLEIDAPPHQLNDKPRDMAFRHKVLHIRRQEQRLIDIPGTKILAHSPTLNQTRSELNSDYSDRLLD